MMLGGRGIVVDENGQDGEEAPYADQYKKEGEDVVAIEAHHMHSVLFRSARGSGLGRRTRFRRSHSRLRATRRRCSQRSSFPSTAILLNDLAINPGAELIQVDISLDVGEVPTEAETVEAFVAQEASIEMLLGEASGVILGGGLGEGLALEGGLRVAGKGGAPERAVEDAGEAVFGFHECIILHIMGGHFNPDNVSLGESLKSYGLVPLLSGYSHIPDLRLSY